MRPLGIFGEDDAREMHRQVLGQQSSQPAFDVARNQTIHNMLYYALLLEDLDPATDPLTGYTQANVRVIRYVQPMVANSLDMEESLSSEGIVRLTNRFTTFSAKSGDLLMVIRNASEWAPVNVASSVSQKHARITACLGNGYYSATLPESVVFSLPPLTGTGTATGTGSGQTNECEPCQWITGENLPGTGTAGNVGPVSCGSVVQPSRVGMPSGGTTIYCYDPRKLSLSVGSHVVVTNMGDTVDSPETGTGTGTGTGVPKEILWIILTGNYDLIAIPDRHYTCCDNVVVLTRCDNYIVEGFYCIGTEISCPGTGTGTV